MTQGSGTNTRPEGRRGAFCEALRFPIVDAYNVPGMPRDEAYQYNRVTFVHYTPRGTPLPTQVGVVGTFANLYEVVPLERVANHALLRAAAAHREGDLHRYKLVVDGAVINDAINPQVTVTDTGEPWSRFFTWGCTTPLCFERWELAILDRFTSHILPFRVKNAGIFLRNFYDYRDEKTKATDYGTMYRLDQSGWPDRIVAFTVTCRA